MVCLCALVHSPVTWALTALIALAMVAYLLSTTARYYIRMTGYNMTIFFTACICTIYCIPAWIYTEGAGRVFECCRILFPWMDITVTVRNKKHLDIDKPCVLICNHQSSLDVVVMAYTWPEKCTCMMKDSLKYIPFFNICCILAHAIFVKRSSREGGISALKQAANVMKEKNLKVWVFPEGTRHHEKGMLPFKKGAFNLAVSAQIPIVPIVASDYSPFYSKPDKYFKSGGQIVVEVLEPISTLGDFGMWTGRFLARNDEFSYRSECGNWLKSLKWLCLTLSLDLE
ncbi:hypothetical protein L596_013832 [Steinernema carpocapsae]|uniref:1-acyl-sn-glycerol-3-phosphate acyltransferase n=1 Tax=Steinernema carpocapsae TaxID=34508 RepID=A0A4U5P1H1_STECR|nr:hypothetical protein L596_013832 [Steinernema carpocapsae]